MKDRDCESPGITQKVNSKTWTENNVTNALDTLVIRFVYLLFIEHRYLLI